mgnify:FL=1
MKVQLLADQVAYLAHEAARVVDPKLPAWAESAEAQTESMAIVRGYERGETVISQMYTRKAGVVFNRIVELAARAKPAAQVAGVVGIDVGAERKFNGC